MQRRQVGELALGRQDQFHWSEESFVGTSTSTLMYRSPFLLVPLKGTPSFFSRSSFPWGVPAGILSFIFLSSKEVT